MRLAATILAALAVALTLVGTLKLYRMDPKGYGAEMPAGNFSIPERFQRPTEIVRLLRDQREATRWVFAGVVVQFIAALLAVAAG